MTDTKKILDWITLLKTKPGMVIVEKIIDYKILRNYIAGYLDGLGDTQNINLRNNIRIWYNEKMCRISNLDWSEQIYRLNHDKSDSEMQQLLVQSLYRYFVENPSWHKN